ncbi:uncharacterized protein K441DRAFT_267786 [Cenococcum geophilum 1.58]|uniref:uncharacterized protein n=1 Tax=Cenococcum geophilum 1.58 TaxID=794803 RepID=UPI00358EFF26|nr:hypothetical protein K441DRAFT_267786 [Cenococcum geophilum 1.58]
MIPWPLKNKRGEECRPLGHTDISLPMQRTTSRYLEFKCEAQKVSFSSLALPSSFSLDIYIHIFETKTTIIASVYLNDCVAAPGSFEYSSIKSFSQFLMEKCNLLILGRQTQPRSLVRGLRRMTLRSGIRKLKTTVTRSGSNCFRQSGDNMED